ncbi:GtrA family protein [Microvirga arabica]|nr:GtrA family protein [Microvirga arabica]MBM1172008.1 GtrA family protein [Microvirga arabica]
MSERGGPTRTLDEARTFYRFCAVGAVGFLTDVLLALALVATGMSPLLARGLAIPPALFVTFNLNRRWSFKHAAGGSYFRQLAAYLVTQSFGASCNFLIFMLALSMLPQPFNEPAPSIVLASGAALVVNYLGSRFLVFRQGRA